MSITQHNYTPTDWNNNHTKLSAENFQHMENGIAANTQTLNETINAVELLEAIFNGTHQENGTSVNNFRLAFNAETNTLSVIVNLGVVGSSLDMTSDVTLQMTNAATVSGVNNGYIKIFGQSFKVFELTNGLVAKAKLSNEVQAILNSAVTSANLIIGDTTTPCQIENGTLTIPLSALEENVTAVVANAVPTHNASSVAHQTLFNNKQDKLPTYEANKYLRTNENGILVWDDIYAVVDEEEIAEAVESYESNHLPVLIITSDTTNPYAAINAAKDTKTILFKYVDDNTTTAYLKLQSFNSSEAIFIGIYKTSYNADNAIIPKMAYVLINSGNAISKSSISLANNTDIISKIATAKSEAIASANTTTSNSIANIKQAYYATTVTQLYNNREKVGSSPVFFRYNNHDYIIEAASASENQSSLSATGYAVYKDSSTDCVISKLTITNGEVTTTELSVPTVYELFSGTNTSRRIYTKAEADTLLATKQANITASGILSSDGNGNITGSQYAPIDPSKVGDGLTINANGVISTVERNAFYSTYSAMVTALNAATKASFSIASNIIIGTINVPDAYVSEVSNTKSTYTYTTDEALAQALQTVNGVKIGYFVLHAAESAQIDTSNFAEIITITKTELENATLASLQAYDSIAKSIIVFDGVEMYVKVPTNLTGFMFFKKFSGGYIFLRKSDAVGSASVTNTYDLDNIDMTTRFNGSNDYNIKALNKYASIISLTQPTNYADEDNTVPSVTALRRFTTANFVNVSAINTTIDNGSEDSTIPTSKAVEDRINEKIDDITISVVDCT